MDKKYLVITENANGDRWETVVNSAEEANSAAARAWSCLTRNEKKRQHIYACVVKREWLGEDAIDEETGEIDWRMFDQADSFPGAFDSDDAETLRAAARKWESESRDAESYDYIGLDLDLIHFDLDRGCWVCPAEIDDSRAELFLRDGRVIADLF